MPDDTDTVSDSVHPASHWWDVWVLALTRPAPATFALISRTAKAGTAQACLWVGLATLVGNAAALILSFVRGAPWQPGDQVLFVAGPVLALILFGILSLLTHAAAHLLGASGSFKQLAVSLAAFYAPLAGMAFFVFGSLLFLPLAVYWLVLNAVAIKGVYALSWGKTLLAMLPVLALGVLPFVAAVLILVLALS